MCGILGEFPRLAAQEKRRRMRDCRIQKHLNRLPQQRRLVLETRKGDDERRYQASQALATVTQAGPSSDAQGRRGGRSGQTAVPDSTSLPVQVS